MLVTKKDHQKDGQLGMCLFHCAFARRSNNRPKAVHERNGTIPIVQGAYATALEEISGSGMSEQVR